MFSKIEHRVFRDPIHGYINVYHQVIWDCINTKEFQRLRRIKQLGASFQVYQTAEHSRFSHSLGVYEVARRMLSEVEDLNAAISEYEKIVTLLAALLHDVGHGPFSHTFEAISQVDHEKYTEMIILGNSEINQVLSNIDPKLALEVVSIINHTHPNQLLSQIVSSQLDADRMDYLLRDAYFTGTSYGSFDINRILRTMRLKDNKLVIKASGIHAVEDYIMARYHMYWNVYFHPTSRAYEAILYSLFKRLKHLKSTNKLDEYQRIKVFLNEKIVSSEAFLNLDESIMLYYINEMLSSDDEILKDLANRLLNRKLFTYEDLISQDQQSIIEAKLEAKSYDKQYYMFIDSLEQTPYVPYAKNNSSLIYILDNNDKVVELSQVSEIVAAIASGKEKIETKIFYPREI